MIHAAPPSETRAPYDVQQFNAESDYVLLRRSRVPLLCLALLVGVSSLAHAQDVPPPTAQLDAPPPPDDSQQPETSSTQSAREHVARGESLYDAGNFEGAIAEFQRAYELLAGHAARYQVLYNLGLCHERLGHYAEALRFYTRYLEEGGPEAGDRAAVQASMRTLEGLLGKLVLHIRFEQNSPSSEIEVWIDQRLVGHAAGEYLLPSGRHSVEVRAEGHESVLREVSLTARTDSMLEVALKPRARGLKPSRSWPAKLIRSAVTLPG